MTIYSLIPIVFIILYLGYWYYTKNKSSQQAQVVDNTDFKAESTNATQYKEQFLNSELPFLKKAMKQTPIDAFNYGNIERNIMDTLKDGMKDKLKGMATLGTVKFTTLATPKYLALSGENLHLFDTNTDGEIDRHLIFEPSQLRDSSLTVYPMEGQIKAQAEARGKNVKAYKLALKADGKTMELIVYSSLIFTEIPETPANAKMAVQAIVIANDFLKQLGDRYPNLKVPLPMLS